MDAFSWKTQQYRYVLPPVYTETMKNIRKTQLSENENATIRKRNNLKMHPCNPDLFRLFERTSLVVTVSVSNRKLHLPRFPGV